MVTCGETYTACITRRGMLYTFGLGSHGELGLGPADSGKVRSVELAASQRLQPPLLRMLTFAVDFAGAACKGEVGTHAKLPPRTPPPPPTDQPLLQPRPGAHLPAGQAKHAHRLACGERYKAPRSRQGQRA